MRVSILLHRPRNLSCPEEWPLMKRWLTRGSRKPVARNKCSRNVRVLPNRSFVSRNLARRNEVGVTDEATKSVGSSVNARQAQQWKICMTGKQLRIKCRNNFPSALDNAPSDPGKCSDRYLGLLCSGTQLPTIQSAPGPKWLFDVQPPVEFPASKAFPSGTYPWHLTL